MKTVLIRKAIQAEETELGKGAILMLPYASKPIVKLLRNRYLKDNSCIEGDIDYLFEFEGVGIEN